MKYILLFSIFLISLTACNKNQKATNKLDGEWKATKYIGTDINGNTGDFISYGYNIIFSFNECSLKDQGYCEHSRTISLNNNPSETFSYSYKVTTEGNIIELNDISTSAELGTMVIHKLSKKNLIISEKFSSTSFQMEFEKI